VKLYIEVVNLINVGNNSQPTSLGGWCYCS